MMYITTQHVSGMGTFAYRTASQSIPAMLTCSYVRDNVHAYLACSILETHNGYIMIYALPESTHTKCISSLGEFSLEICIAQLACRCQVQEPLQFS